MTVMVIVTMMMMMEVVMMIDDDVDDNDDDNDVDDDKMIMMMTMVIMLKIYYGDSFIVNLKCCLPFRGLYQTVSHRNPLLYLTWPHPNSDSCPYSSLHCSAGEYSSPGCLLEWILYSSMDSPASSRQLERMVHL
ncbi:hypothetical protein DPMN_000964 [Dreissena polymorpha]|uniref:Uncharacterized protein n=1 Tax=Dreissena polymorpha TaxID=45954 RepID=A0A9D4MKS8_DREPO|nr:hypothetical protein DPMN_000964 [Dreissena polymorpha]